MHADAARIKFCRYPWVICRLDFGHDGNLLLGDLAGKSNVATAVREEEEAAASGGGGEGGEDFDGTGL